MWERKTFRQLSRPEPSTQKGGEISVLIFSLFTSCRPHHSVLLRFVAVWHGTQHSSAEGEMICASERSKRESSQFTSNSQLWNIGIVKHRKKCIAEHWRWDSEKRRRRGGVKSDRRENKTRSINSNSFTMNNNWRNLMKFFFAFCYYSWCI